MFSVIKKSGKKVSAYRLGDESEVLLQLSNEGKIKATGNDTYEVFSEEAFTGESGKGETAHTGDYIKISTSGFPYPNDREFFENNHRKISENTYEQIPKKMSAWDISEPMCPEIEFLKEKKGLKIDPTNSEKCFSAFLWGTEEAAPCDALILFYSITRNENGNISDADYNFITRSEFDKFYDICP